MHIVHNKALDEKAAALDQKTAYKNHTRQGRKAHTCCFCRKKAAAGHLIRLAKREDFFNDDGELIFHWEARGKIIDDRDCVSDPDWFDFRARRSTGWKEHKHRHQWEHGVCEKEKHRKNRARKALDRGEFPVLPE
jgi:hypothetical protein